MASVDHALGTQLRIPLIEGHLSFFYPILQFLLRNEQSHLDFASTTPPNQCYSKEFYLLEFRMKQSLHHIASSQKYAHYDSLNEPRK